MNSRLNRKVLSSILLVICFCYSAWCADTISGTVRNGSKDQPAANDQVVLLRLDQGMQEEARTQTDAQGAFHLTPQYPEKMYLVRIVHQDVNYDVRITPGTPLAIDVFDAAPKVQGVTGTIEIIRVGTNGNLLHVSDMIDIMNGSSPPVTQAGKRTFEVFLPSQAKMDSVMAASPGGIGVRITAAPVPGQPGHYTVDFPLRPGDTKFAFNYNLPYDGHAAFQPNLLYPLQQLAVMIPPTMKFTPGSPAFRSLPIGDRDYLVHAASPVKAGKGLKFEISGAGPIPPLNARAQSKAPAQTSVLSDPVIAPTGQGKTQPVPAASATLDPVLRWWVLGGVAFFVAVVCGFLIWRARRAAGASKSAPPISQAGTLVDTLKEELFELETQRLRGSISQEEYETAKHALESTVKRAVARTGQA